jgi:hypothetical protein
MNMTADVVQSLKYFQTTFRKLDLSAISCTNDGDQLFLTEAPEQGPFFPYT